MNVDAREAALSLLDLGTGGGGGGGGATAGPSARSISSSSSAAGGRSSGKGGRGSGGGAKEGAGGKVVPMKRRASAAGFHLGTADNDDKPHSSRKGKEKEKPVDREKVQENAMPPPTSPSSSFYDPPPPSDPPADPSETIRCICGFTHDDGFSIACDMCSRWCHAACFGIGHSEVPDEWHCWECAPREVDREQAVRTQRAQWKSVLEREKANGGSGRNRRSPGVERKHRRGEGSHASQSGHVKKKRRISIVHISPITTSASVMPSIAPVSAAQPLDGLGNEDDVVDIDEPWTHSYVPLANDLIPHADTRAKLRQHAQNWRGITALTPHPPNSTTSPYAPSPIPVTLPSYPSDYDAQIHLRALPTTPVPPYLSLHSHLSIRPPSYAIHTVQPIKTESLITPYTSLITPSSSYLSDPLNGYAHLGMPRPFVHLVGPPLDVALDARVAGGKGRFVRNGCRPNAVIRPVLCAKRDKRQDDVEEEEEEQRKNDTTLTFGVFALRDLKANEEVVLGWEWDDGNAIHSLPALIESPKMFPLPPSFSSSKPTHSHSCTSPTVPPTTGATTAATPPTTHTPSTASTTAIPPTTTPSTATSNPSPPAVPHPETTRPHQYAYLRQQMANILHLLSSTFTTCACGARAKDCALVQMAAFVDGELSEHDVGVDLGPLIGRRRGFRTKEKVPFSGGLSGVEMDVDVDEREEEGEKGEGGKEGGKEKEKMVNGRSRKKGKGRKGARVRRRTVNGREREEAMREESPAKEIRIQSPGPPESILLSVDEPADDPQGTIDADELPSEPPLMPPKMRKKWFDRTDLTFSTTAASGNEGGEAEVDASPVDDMTQDEAPTQAVDSSRDSRPIFHRRKDHLIDRTFQSEAVDSEAGNSQISPDANTLESEPVAGPSTSKLDAQAPPPPIASPSTHFAKLSLVSPGTGAYAVIGSKTASISEVLDVGSSKGKGKENVMEDVAGSPRMSWSAFTRKEFEGEHGDIEDTVDEVIKEVTRPEEEVVEGRVHPEEEAFPDEATSPTPAIHPPVTPTTHPPVPLPPTAHISAAISPPEETASATPIAATDTDIEMEDLQLPSLPQLPVEAENQPPSPPFVHESLSPMSSIVSPTAPPPTTLTVDTRPPCSVQSPSPTPVSPLSPSPPYLGEDLHFSDHGPLSPLTSPPSPHRLPLEPSPADNALSLPPTNDSITHIHEHSPLSPMSTIPSSPMMEGGDLMSGIQDEQPNEGGKSTTSIASSLNSPVSPTPNVVIRSPSPPLHSPVVPVQGTPSESHIDRSPPPPPSAPKVKMSLKDFALRKKKQREELTRSIQTSPLSVASVLAPSPVGTNEVLTPSPKVSSTTLLSSPLVTNSQLAIDDGQESRAVDAVNHDSPAVVKHINASPDNIQFDKQQPISINVDEDPPMVPTKINGHHPPPLLSSTLHNAKLTLTPSPPPLLNIKSAPSPPLIQEVTREAKVELVEQSVPLEPSPLPNDAPAVVSVVSVTSSRDVPKSVGNIHVPPLADQPQLRRISQQEEGEIGEASPPPPPPKRFDSYRPLRTSPPTHPRSFQAAMSPPGGGRPSPASAPPYRSSGSSFSSSPSTAGLTSRPVPSAPRALRNGIPPSQSSQSSYVPPSRTFSGSSYIPRGPSADRDRQDRDRGDRWPPYRNRRWAR